MSIALVAVYFGFSYLGELDFGHYGMGVTLASGFSFALLVGIQTWTSVIGLIAGGLIVAPFAARLTRHMPKKALMIGVGLLISGLSAWTILRALGL